MTPPDETKTMEFIGIATEDVYSTTSQIITLDNVYTINNQLLETHFNCVLSEMDAKFPCTLHVQYVDTTIVGILE